MNTKWGLLSSYLASKVPVKKQMLANQDWPLSAAFSLSLKERREKAKPQAQTLKTVVLWFFKTSLYYKQKEIMAAAHSWRWGAGDSSNHGAMW